MRLPAMLISLPLLWLSLAPPASGGKIPQPKRELPDPELRDTELPGTELPGAGPPQDEASLGADATAAWLAWQFDLPRVPHPEPSYRFLADVHAEIAEALRERPGLVRAERVGSTVRGEPIWGFRVTPRGREVQHKVLVFGGIHAMEWVSVEVATEVLLDQIRHPAPGVEVFVIPVLNVDGRLKVEKDLREGRNVYRRANAKGVDLNRDFAVNREAKAIWRHLLPAYYETSPAPLSQPESRSLDRLAAAERFDVSVSLHAFGGYIYTPWAGLFERPPDWPELYALGNVMERGQGAHAYRTRQLARWGFFFRGHGMELDHLYGRYGTKAFLIELTHSGLNPLKPSTFRSEFRLYNPVDPTHHTELGFRALHALVAHLAWQARVEPAPRRPPEQG